MESWSWTSVQKLVTCGIKQLLWKLPRVTRYNCECNAIAIKSWRSRLSRIKSPYKGLQSWRGSGENYDPLPHLPQTNTELERISTAPFQNTSSHIIHIMHELVRICKICEVMDSRIGIVLHFPKFKLTWKREEIQRKNWELRVMCRSPSQDFEFDRDMC